MQKGVTISLFIFLPLFSCFGIEFTRFPVDLGELFYQRDMNNPYYNYIVNEICKNQGSVHALLTPFAFFESGEHVEGRGKWYISCWEGDPQGDWWGSGHPRYFEVRMPAPGTLYKGGVLFMGGEANILPLLSTNIPESIIMEVNGNQVEVYDDSQIFVDMGEGVILDFTHFYLLSTIVDQLLAQGKVELNEGDLVGYTGVPYALDFRIQDTNNNNGISVNPNFMLNLFTPPLGYFTPELQQEIRNYFYGEDTPELDSLYEAWKENGMVEFSRLDNSLNINIDGTVWGLWIYQSGFTGNAQLTEEEKQVIFLPSINRGIIALVNLAKTNPETFYRLRPGGEPFPDNFVGIYADYFENNEGANAYRQTFGDCYLLRMEGDDQTGIFLLRDKETGDTIKYLRYQLIENNPEDRFDDQLKLEWFDTLAEAQGGFTNNYFLYIKDPALWPYYRETTYTRIIPNQDNPLTLSDGSGISYFPAGSFSGEKYLYVSMHDYLPPFLVYGFRENKAIGRMLEIGSDYKGEGDFFTTVRFYYTDEEVANLGIDEKYLRLFTIHYYDFEWKPAGIRDRGVSAPTNQKGDYGVDTENNFVWANVDSFSFFAAGYAFPQISGEKEGGGGGGGGGICFLSLLAPR